jgi:hypothetical protein
MYEGTPIKYSTTGALGNSRSTANSLFQNILAISSCESIFYRGPPDPHHVTYEE